MVDIEEIMATWVEFKEQYKGELEDFNNQLGKFDRTSLLKRARDSEFFSRIENMPRYLAISVLIDVIQDAPINKQIDEHALENGWRKTTHVRSWRDDEDRALAIEHYLRYPNEKIMQLIPFEYMYETNIDGFTWLGLSSCRLVILNEPEPGLFDAKFGEDDLIRSQVNALTSIPASYNRKR